MPEHGQENRLRAGSVAHLGSTVSKIFIYCQWGVVFAVQFRQYYIYIYSIYTHNMRTNLQGKLHGALA